MMYQIFSFIFSALILYFIVKKLKFKAYDLKIANHKRSAIISLIVVLVTAIIMFPLILSFMKIFKIFIINQLGIKNGSGSAVIINAILALLEITPVIIIMLIRKESLYSLGITKKNFFKSVLIGFISYIIYFAFMVIMKQYKFPFPPNSVFSLWAFLNFILLAFAEEVLFRGYLQTRLTKWLGDQRGLVFTAFLFSFSHLFQRILSVDMSLSSALVSCIAIIPFALFMGYLFSKCKDVVAPTVLHTFYNFFLNHI